MDEYYFMWVKRSCPYCQQAQDLMFRNQIPHAVFAMDDDLPTLEKVKQNFNWKTVPIVVAQRYDGKQHLIGGYTNLAKYIEEKNND